MSSSNNAIATPATARYSPAQIWHSISLSSPAISLNGSAISPSFSSASRSVLETPLHFPNNLPDGPIAAEQLPPSSGPAIADQQNVMHPLDAEPSSPSMPSPIFYDQQERQAEFADDIDAAFMVMQDVGSRNFYSPDAFLFRSRLNILVDYICFCDRVPDNDYAQNTSDMYHREMDMLRLNGTPEKANLFLTELMAKLFVIMEDRKQNDQIISSMVRSIAYDFFGPDQHGMHFSHNGMFARFPSGLSSGTWLNVFGYPGAVGVLNMLQCLKSDNEVAV